MYWGFTGRRHRRCPYHRLRRRILRHRRVLCPAADAGISPEDGEAGKSAANTPDLTGHTLMIYCGAA